MRELQALCLDIATYKFDQEDDFKNLQMENITETLN